MPTSLSVNGIKIMTVKQYWFEWFSKDHSLARKKEQVIEWILVLWSLVIWVEFVSRNVPLLLLKTRIILIKS